MFRDRRHNRITTISELADYLKVHRHTIRKKVKKYPVDFYSLYSVLDFVRRFK